MSQILDLEKFIGYTIFQICFSGGNKLPEDQMRKVQQFRDFLDRIHVLDPAKRISLNECLLHPFIQDRT